VVSLSPGGYWTRHISQLGIELITLERRRSYEVKRLWSLMSIILSRKPGIIHAYQPPGNTYASLAGLLTNRSKIVVSRRSFDSETQSNAIKKAVDRKIYRAADAVVCNSRSLYDNLKDRYGEQVKALVIYNGIDATESLHPRDTEEIKRELGLPVHADVVGTVGRLIPIKNHRLFLDIAADVVKKRPETHFVLVGDGPLEDQLQLYAKHLGIADRVIFAGQRDDVASLLTALDVFLFTSSNRESEGEGLPNAVMEAMLSEVPCVASSAGGTKELFRDGEAGYLVSPEEKEKYVQRTLTLLEDKSLRTKMGRTGRSIILERYSVQQMVKRFEDLYDSILSGNFH
jgi:glycosyltransferase involved in cell wall biosynthesis